MGWWRRGEAEVEKGEQEEEEKQKEEEQVDEEEEKEIISSPQLSQYDCNPPVITLAANNMLMASSSKSNA